jgi:hypothetical protein
MSAGSRHVNVCLICPLEATKPRDLVSPYHKNQKKWLNTALRHLNFALQVTLGGAVS